MVWVFQGFGGGRDIRLWRVGQDIDVFDVEDVCLRVGAVDQGVVTGDGEGLFVERFLGVVEPGAGRYEGGGA